MERIVDAARANRLARAILSDVLLYNPEAVRLGIQHDDLFVRLRDQLEEARSYFEERVDPAVLLKGNFIDRAVVDVLVYGSRSVHSRIW